MLIKLRLGLTVHTDPGWLIQSYHIQELQFVSTFHNFPQSSAFLLTSYEC